MNARLPGRESDGKMAPLRRFLKSNVPSKNCRRERRRSCCFSSRSACARNKRHCPSRVVFPMSSSGLGWTRMRRRCAASDPARELVPGCQCGAGGLRASGRGIARRVRDRLPQRLAIDDQPLRGFRSYEKSSPDWTQLGPALVAVRDVWTMDRPAVFGPAKDRPVLFTAAAWAEVLLTRLKSGRSRSNNRPKTSPKIQKIAYGSSLSKVHLP